MKFYIISKNQLIKITAAVLVLAAAVVCSVNVFADNGGRRIPIYCVDTKKKEIAISFDAAWGNDDTEMLINIMKEYNVKATFFVVGQWVDKYPESVKQLADAGHSIQNHSGTHPNMPNLSEAEQAKEIIDCNEKIKAVTGIRPTLFRAPYGAYNNTLINTVEDLDMYTIQWDVDSLDWQDSATAESIAERVISKVKNGSIILCHNDADHTPKALPTIFKTLQDQGYTFVLMKDLIYTKDYTIDHSGKQIFEGKQEDG